MLNCLPNKETYRTRGAAEGERERASVQKRQKERGELGEQGPNMCATDTQKATLWGSQLQSLLLLGVAAVAVAVVAAASASASIRPGRAFNNARN